MHAGAFAPLIFKPEGAPTLAPKSDRRKAIAPTADDLSDVITDADITFDDGDINH